MAEVSRSPGPAPAVTPTPARTVSGSPGAGAAVRGRRSASSGAGSSEGERLPEATRAALEQGLGADLSAVRVRRDSRSQEVAKRLSARAFAYGPTIVLGPNERPDDLPLMAHEAAHVVQQGAAPRLQAYSSSGGDSLEHEARAASSAVSSGQSYQVQGTSAPRVQRLGLSDILDYFADKANNIPGFRMFTVIIGVNPINGASVERSGANIIRAIIEFLPGGKLITDALENNGVLAKVGAWVEGQFKTLGMAGSAFKNALSEFIDSLGWRDIFHLGDVWTRAKRIFTDPIDRLIDFGKGLLVGIIRFVKEAVLRPLGKLAEGTRGYDLLKAVLGSDPVTGDTVPQTAETLIGGFMKLINQEEIWNNIKKSNAIPRAWAWFKKALKGLWALVSSFPQRVIDGFKSLELFDIVLVPRAFVKIGKVFLGFLADFISWAGGTIWDLLKIIFAVVAPEVMPYLSKVEASFKTILKDPIRFVKNLVAAGKLGFNQFRDKIGTHLKNSLIDWLTGSLPGVYIPKALEIKEILLFVLSVLGISWTNIRAKLVKQFGEPVVKGLEVGFTVVKKLVTEGPAAAWDEIKSELGNLREQAMGAITTYVVETVVKKAAAKLVSMLIPGAAFIQAILTTYDTVMVFVDKLSKIVQVVKAFLDSIMAIAAGQFGSAANKVESTLAGLLTLAISFLAGFAGLGRIADKIMGLLKERVWTPIDKALDKGVAAIGNAGKAVLAKLTGKNEKRPTNESPESHENRWKRGTAALKVFMTKEVSDEEPTAEGFEVGLAVIKQQYGFSNLVLMEDGVTIDAAMSPGEKFKNDSRYIKLRNLESNKPSGTVLKAGLSKSGNKRIFATINDAKKFVYVVKTGVFQAIKDDERIKASEEELRKMLTGERPNLISIVEQGKSSNAPGFDAGGLDIGNAKRPELVIGEVKGGFQKNDQYFSRESFTAVTTTLSKNLTGARKSLSVSGSEKAVNQFDLAVSSGNITVVIHLFGRAVVSSNVWPKLEMTIKQKVRLHISKSYPDVDLNVVMKNVNIQWTVDKL